MHDENPNPTTDVPIWRWLRNAALLVLLFAVFQFLVVISWGAINIPLLALLGVGVAVLFGFLYVAFGIVLGIVLGWLISILTFCKRCVFSIL